MKISFNPSNSNKNILDLIKNNKDIIFDLKGHSIFARGVEFKGTDTNTWRDIKINNVSIGSHTLDLRNGSNTTLTNTNGVVTINSTWRPVVDNLTSDSTTSSLSAKQGKVLKALIDGKSNSGHTHDDRYLKLTGGTMAGNALITFADSGSWGTGKGPQGARGGLYWTGQSDYAKLYAEETVGDNLDLVIQFGDDNSNGLSIRNKANTQTSYISSSGVITTGTFKGNLDWSYITNKPSSYTPSAHTHAWNSLTHSSTTENQAILTNGKANGWKLQTLNIARWDNAANNAHSHANKSVLDGITSALVYSWNTAYNFVSNITGTDTDKVINKWEEIVNFLAGITEDNKLNTLLNSKLSVYELADNTNVGTIKNNGIYYSTTDASSRTLINSPFNTGFAFINMTSYDGGDNLRRSRLAFNAFGEIKVSDDGDQANTAETWYNVLTSKNSGINGSTIKLNGTSITVYSSGTADGRYVKKSGDTMSGVLTIDTTNFGALTIKRNDDANGASIQFRGKSSVYGYIGLNNSTKDKQFLRWSSDTSRIYTILDTSSTCVSNNKGYINGLEITQVNNSDKVDNRHAISTTPNTGIIYKAAIYTNYSLTSYWVRLASIPSIDKNNDFVATIHVQSGHSNPGRSAILLVYLRGDASSFMSKSFKICCNSNYDPNRFRLYYKGSDKTSEIWYQTVGQWDGVITTVISQSAEGWLYEGLTLYSGSITAVQTPSMSTYLSAQVSTITDNISGNASTATKLQTARSIWGQSFDGTADVDNTLRIKQTTGSYCEGIRIQTADSTWATIILGGTGDSGTNANAWSIHRKADNNFAISRNSSDGTNGLVMTSVGMGLGTTAPTQRLDVAGNIRATGQIIREGHSNMWVYGRSVALLRETSAVGYHTLWSLKTTNGSWDFGEYNAGSNWNNVPVLSYITDSNYNSGNNATTYQIKFPLASGTVALTSNIPNPTNYYWANVKISASSSTTTSPTVHTLTATRVCAGHNPGIDNSISCSNWFRSSGNTGWYNTTYQGGWYMSDTYWIRAHNGVGIYTSGQIYSSSSIRMSNILLEHTNEINNSANDGIHLNLRNSGNVSLCYGGGNVGIGTTTPSYKLDVNGQMSARGFHHSYMNSDNYILLAGGGYKSFGGDYNTPIFLGCLNLYCGSDGTINSFFYCLGETVPFSYTRGGNYCKIFIPDTARLSFYIMAAIASVNYSGRGMDTWTGQHRGSGAWWLHCYASGSNEVRVKGFCQANGNNDSWWGGNPLWNYDYGANIITVCIFGHVEYR